jgi:hypothetical protein
LLQTKPGLGANTSTGEVVVVSLWMLWRHDQIPLAAPYYFQNDLATLVQTTGRWFDSFQGDQFALALPI